MVRPAPLLLFLDFDGVLHHFFPLAGVPDAENAHFFFLPAFEKAVRALSVPVEIVIASTWRNTYSLPQIRQRFSPDIAAKIIGVTPKKGSGKGNGGRQVEVEQWLLDNHRQGQAWVGIDDYPLLYNPGSAVVECKDQFGRREAALLEEAASDPKAYALAHPVSHEQPQKLVIVAGVRSEG